MVAIVAANALALGATTSGFTASRLFSLVYYLRVTSLPFVGLVANRLVQQFVNGSWQHWRLLLFFLLLLLRRLLLLPLLFSIYAILARVDTVVVVSVVVRGAGVVNAEASSTSCDWNSKNVQALVFFFSSCGSHFHR
jgi:hypothetical protein